MTDRVGPRGLKRLPRWARWAAPVAISAAILAALLSRMDAGAVLASLSPGIVLWLSAALLLYGALSLALEALSLARVTAPAGAALGITVCARIKAASYPLSLVNYGLGAATLTWLIQRRSGVSVSRVAGMVVLVSALDLGALLALTTLGAGFFATQAPALRAGVIGLAAAALLGGLVVLRTPRQLGPLERLRSLSVFDAIRTASGRLLVELMGLRLAFVGIYVGMIGLAFAIFGIRVPLGDLLVGSAAVALVGALPIALAGLGTGQAAFVYLFRHWADPEILLACSLAVSAGIILMRSALGLLFAGEFTREALRAARDGAR